MENRSRSELTPQYVRELLHYDPETGLFYWRVDKASNAMTGYVAGAKTHRQGYVYIRIDGVSYAAHRLAWLWTNGEWPIGGLDHKDTNRANNSWSNLRLATNSQNHANRRLPKANKTGFKGVHRRTKWNAYEAAIKVNGKLIYLGSFRTANEAADAYSRASKKHFGEFARGR